MTTDSPDFRIEIRYCVEPSNLYVWEIYSVRRLTRVIRSSRFYPTRGAAMKAGKKALLRMIVPPRGQLMAKPQRESGNFPSTAKLPFQRDRRLPARHGAPKASISHRPHPLAVVPIRLPQCSVRRTRMPVEVQPSSAINPTQPNPTQLCKHTS